MTPIYLTDWRGYPHFTRAVVENSLPLFDEHKREKEKAEERKRERERERAKSHLIACEILHATLAYARQSKSGRRP